jgi:hypothetical protein
MSIARLTTPNWASVTRDNSGESQNAEFAWASSAFLFSSDGEDELRSQSITQEEESSGADRAECVHDRCVRNKVGHSHHGQAAEHHFPGGHPFAIDEGHEADRTEEQIADQICAAHLGHHVGHIVFEQLEPRQDEVDRPLRRAMLEIYAALPPSFSVEVAAATTARSTFSYNAKIDIET